MQQIDMSGHIKVRRLRNQSYFPVLNITGCQWTTNPFTDFIPSPPDLFEGAGNVGRNPEIMSDPIAIAQLFKVVCKVRIIHWGQRSCDRIHAPEYNKMVQEEGIEPPVFTAVGVCSTGRCRRRWATLAYMEEGGVIETLCHH